MDLSARTSPTLISRVLPLWAVFTDDLRQTLRHWALISWSMISLMLAIVWLVTANPSPAVTTGSGPKAGGSNRSKATPGLRAAALLPANAVVLPNEMAFELPDSGPEIVPVQYVGQVAGRSRGTSAGNSSWSTDHRSPAAYSSGYSRNHASGTVSAPAANWSHSAGYTPRRSRPPIASGSATEPPRRVSPMPGRTIQKPAIPAENASDTETSTVSDRDDTASGRSTKVKVSGTTVAGFVARLLRMHLLWWVTFVIVLGASCISGEADVAPNAVLCRGVARWQYYVGKCLSRMLAVGAVYLLLTLPAIAAGVFRLPNDLSIGGLVGTLSIGVVLLTSTVAISVAAGIWFRGALTSVAVVWMGFYGVGLTLSILGVTDLSPLVLVERIPDLLRGTDRVLSHRLPQVLSGAAILTTAISLGCYCRQDV